MIYANRKIYPMSINLITKNLIHSTQTRMALKGGVTTNDEVISAVAKNLREFLAEHKREHLGETELIDFYKRYFPKANLRIINGKLNRAIKNNKAIATSSVTYTDDMKEIKEFQIYLQSKSPVDKLKWLFGIKNNKKAFYINDLFSKIYIHEYIHFMQRYLKPIDKSIQNSILSNHPKNLEITMAIKNDIINADKNLVYTREKGKDFSAERFRQKLMNLLYCPEYSTDMLVKDELKFLIRHAQSEKQAYEIELEEGAWLSHPILMKNKYYRKHRIKSQKNELERDFRFAEKIKIMKEEYFKLIQKERKKTTSNMKNDPIDYTYLQIF